MARAKPLQLGFELVVHKAMEGFIRPLYTKLLAEPLLDRHRAGKPAGGGQARLSLREHSGWQTLLA